MTWPAELPGADTDWDRFAAGWPEATAALAGLVTAAWEETNPVLLELCRARMAQLLGARPGEGGPGKRARDAGLTPARADAVAAWPTSPLFSEAERACLALAEQFVMDANGVTDDQVAAVTAELGPDGCYAFIQALSALETFQRGCLILGIDPAPGPEALGAAAAGPGSEPGA